MRWFWSLSWRTDDLQWWSETWTCMGICWKDCWNTVLGSNSRVSDSVSLRWDSRMSNNFLSDVITVDLGTSFWEKKNALENFMYLVCGFPKFRSRLLTKPIIHKIMGLHYHKMDYTACNSTIVSIYLKEEWECFYVFFKQCIVITQNVLILSKSFENVIKSMSVKLLLKSCCKNRTY